ncbi:Fimbrin [Diplonema papillatum]|nr:Fimbrin [Diplonema papillatum]
MGGHQRDTPSGKAPSHLARVDFGSTTTSQGYTKPPTVTPLDYAIVRVTSAGNVIPRRFSGVPLKPMREVSGTDSPRAPEDLNEGEERSEQDRKEVPYCMTTAESPTGVGCLVTNGFDKLSAALQKCIGQLSDDSLDSRLIRVGKWVDRFKADQQPMLVLQRLSTIFQTAIRETQSLAVPNMPLVSAGCTIVHQCLLLLSTMYPPFSDVAQPAYRIVLQAIFFKDAFSRRNDDDALMRLLIHGDSNEAREINTGARSEPMSTAAATDPDQPAKMGSGERCDHGSHGDHGVYSTEEIVRRQLLAFSGKSYFQSLRDVSRKLGQAVTSYEQASREREKLCKALNRIIQAWQRLYKRCLFRAWRNVKKRRLEKQGTDHSIETLTAELKTLQSRQRRMDELVEEVRRDRNLELLKLRDDLKKSEDTVASLNAEKDDCARQLQETEAQVRDLKAAVVEAVAQKAKQTRDSDLRYANFAKQACRTVESLQLPSYEKARLDGAWKPFYAPFVAGDASFTTLNFVGDPEGLLRWVNTVAKKHRCYNTRNVQPLESFGGSATAIHVWACVCGVLSPSHVPHSAVDALFDSATLHDKATVVVQMLRDLSLAEVVDSLELMDGARDRHVLLGIVLHHRFANIATPVFSAVQPFDGDSNDAPQPTRAVAGCVRFKWEPYVGDEGAYPAEIPMPDVVREYKRMSPSDFADHFRVLESRFLESLELADTSLANLLTALAASIRQNERADAQLSVAELQDRPRFVDLQRHVVKDVVSDDEAMNKIRAVAKQHFRHLRKIYRFYGAADTRSLNPEISFDELWKLVTDCKLVVKDVFERTHFRVIFSAADKEEKGRTVLSPTEFMYSLVFIANTRFKARGDDPVDLFRHLLEKWIIPEASFVDLSYFRQSMHDHLVHRMLEKRQNDLLKVFRHFAGMGMTDSSSALSLKEFIRFMSDCKVTDEVCTHHALQQIFINFLDVSKSSQAEMGFDEFIGAVCAVAALKNPAPYLPLHIKFQRFWQNWVLPPLRKQLRLTDGATAVTESQPPPGNSVV